MWSLGIGLVGFGGLVLGPIMVAGVQLRPHVGSAAWWAVTVTLVAAAEEVAIRGALFSALDGVAGPAAAVVITTVAFALIHVPFYGWHVMPLDLAVGAWLGGLRLWSGSASAPAVAHIFADLSAFWL